jgi:cytochrome c-type biogenesis protein CcmH/NrfG
LKAAHSSLLRATEIYADNRFDWQLLGVIAVEIGDDENVFRAYRNLRRLNPEVAEKFYRFAENNR